MTQESTPEPAEISDDTEVDAEVQAHGIEIEDGGRPSSAVFHINTGCPVA